MLDSSRVFLLSHFDIIFFAPVQFDKVSLICFPIFLHLNETKLKCLEQL
jgi:hypothetical protein